jgi:hypothetical protein
MTSVQDANGHSYYLREGPDREQLLSRPGLGVVSEDIEAYLLFKQVTPGRS